MRVLINGESIDAAAGATVAAAAMAAGVATRISVTGQARGPLCGMGICFECRATVDGESHRRTCQMVVAAPAAAPASEPAAALSTGVLVVGAGPAGLAAAARAAEAGLAVALVDDNPELGGQIWRGRVGERGSEAAAWAERARAAGVAVLRQTRVVDQLRPGVLRAESPRGASELSYGKLILATGARERFLPFPGWTLPHVLGAGGLQALAKGGLPLAGKRVVVAGSGPLLLAVAAYLRAHGAVVAAICEQASWPAMIRFGAALTPAKLVQAAKLGRSLRSVPIWMNAWPLEALPGAVVIRRRGRAREIACDYLACGFHLVPNAELATLLGCATQRGAVVVDAEQQTTVAGIYCAGEPTGIGGVELALAEGEIAGLAAAGHPAPAALRWRREKQRRFARRLERAARLRPELRQLPRPDTLVCRCEDVPFARLREHTAWRAAKLQSRCGMGPCQGRVCGPACEFLLGWQPEPVRPPIFPATMAALGE